MQSNDRLGFSLEFGFPALIVLAAAAAPRAAYELIRRTGNVGGYAAEHPHLAATTRYLVDSWGLFFLIVASVIFAAGLLHLVSLRRVNTPAVARQP